jgi:DNA-binding response OmpR family regulator
MTKVMLAEDDASMMYLLKTLLTLEGFEVVTLDIVEDVIGAARSLKPEVLLMDVHLAGKNGVDVLVEMRKQEDLKDLIVIMSSGMNLEYECRDAGANAFLLKPFMPDDLISVIRRNLSQNDRTSHVSIS